MDFRKKKALYTILPVREDELIIMPELAARIEEARQQYRKEKTISLNSHEDIDKYFESM